MAKHIECIKCLVSLVNSAVLAIDSLAYGPGPVSPYSVEQYCRCVKICREAGVDVDIEPPYAGANEKDLCGN